MHRILLITKLLTVALSIHAEASPSRPNVILMLADDRANEDLSSYGSERNQTPRIDQLAGEGLKLNNYYAGIPVCTPFRMALLSASCPARLGWRRGVMGYGFEPKTGISPRIHTLAAACGFDIKLPADTQKTDGVNTWKNLTEVYQNQIPLGHLARHRPTRPAPPSQRRLG